MTNTLLDKYCTDYPYQNSKLNLKYSIFLPSTFCVNDNEFISVSFLFIGYFLKWGYWALARLDRGFGGRSVVAPPAGSCDVSSFRFLIEHSTAPWLGFSQITHLCAYGHFLLRHPTSLWKNQHGSDASFLPPVLLASSLSNLALASFTA